jgi:nicotinate phosphoribosyltransferase
MLTRAIVPRPWAPIRRVEAVTGHSTALLTDHYELTMLAAALRDGTATRRCSFAVFARGLPAGRRYGVVAGTGRLLGLLADFRFGDPELAALQRNGVVDLETARHLARWRFGGDVWGYGEGEVFFPGSPILSVDGTFADCVLLETLLLSVLNHDCAVAAAGSRMVTAAAGRPLLEMGSRRTHEQAAVAAARAAYLVGFAATSNLEAGRRFGVPTSGTSAHAFTLVHDDERTAFASQLAALGDDTTLLVDTYDVDDAVRLGVERSGGRLGAVRIDSGNLPEEARRVRALLDSLGATTTQVVVSGDLDEHSIAELRDVPVDLYGVGTSLVTGSGAPTAGLVYKLVARESTPGGPLQPVAKRSVGKSDHGGRRVAVRTLVDGTATAEVHTALDPAAARRPPTSDPGRRELVGRLVDRGEVVGAEPLTAARERHARALAELPARARELTPGEPALPVLASDPLPR